MAEGRVRLRGGGEVEGSLRGFLDERVRDGDDLRGIASVQAEISGRCADLEAEIVDLEERLRRQLEAYFSRADAVDELLGKVRDGLLELGSVAAGSSLDRAGRVGVGDGSASKEKIVVEKLLALADEAARVETVRSYAETALKLDRLIGEIEDAVSSSMTGKLRQPPSSVNSEDVRMSAIDGLRKTEEILTSIARSQPHWLRLIAAVDDRVDRALAILRPQAIADHRAVLSAIGWPPPLSAPTSEAPASSKNPLFDMDISTKRHYGESFLALCHLQELQRRRRSRHLGSAATACCLPLWGIEELATPVFLSSQKHFPKWTQKPELIFALVFKILRDLVNAMDEILQPLVDQARLTGYSCREEWAAAMVSLLATYLAKEVFPVLAADLMSSDEAKTSWLHLVDQMMMFDQRVKSMASGPGVLAPTWEEEELQRVSSMSVFCDRPDWLDLWAGIELTDALDRFRPELEDPRNWRRSSSPTSLELEEFKSPAAAGAVLRRASAMVDRCRALPSAQLRARFVQLAVAPLLRHFATVATCRCEEAEGLTALVDDEALASVCVAINGARQCESTVTEWSEDLFFLEMAAPDDSVSNGLEEEAEELRRLRGNWLDRVSGAIIRGFEAACQEHLRNKKQWQAEEDEELALSIPLVSALDYLQGKLWRMEAELNTQDFAVLWRGLAAALDQLLLGSVLLGGARFSVGGITRFASELAALQGVLAPWCLRPDRFFPRASEGLRLLTATYAEIDDGVQSQRVHHLTASQTEKLIKARVR
ncbi:RINT-1 / TIP-1 family isoform X1 [Wolffia australiana]